eukprot:Tbor_TRINITY_DN3172_c0_g2::TRINITY_DN3172_c0_g2_i1::g.14633::m.14633
MIRNSILRSSPYTQPIPTNKGPHGRTPTGSKYRQTVKHTHRCIWYKTAWWVEKPFAISYYYLYPRHLLDRDVWKNRWTTKQNNPEPARWEKIVNSMRTTEDRWALVEEEGFMHKVNWKLYSQRLKTELVASRENLPQFTYKMKGAPIAWKKLDWQLARMRGLSVREAMAQCKLSSYKGHLIVFKCLEACLQGAENKGLDKEKLRVAVLSCKPGPCDAQIDIRAKGYYSWKSKKSSNILVCVVEDPEMILPDRTAVPHSSVLALKRAGLHSEPTMLDVPAITAEGI